MLTIRLLSILLEEDLLVEDITDSHDVSNDVLFSLHLTATI